MPHKPLQEVQEVPVIILLCKLIGFCVIASVFDVISRYEVIPAVDVALARAVNSGQVSTRRHNCVTGPAPSSSRRTIPGRTLSILPQTHRGSPSSQNKVLHPKNRQDLPGVPPSSMAEPVFMFCQFLLNRTHAWAPSDSRQHSLAAIGPLAPSEQSLIW